MSRTRPDTCNLKAAPAPTNPTGQPALANGSVEAEMSKRAIRNCFGVLLVAVGLAMGAVAMGGTAVLAGGLNAVGALIAIGPVIDGNQ